MSINHYFFLSLFQPVLRLLRRQSLECTSSFPSLNSNINHSPPALQQSHFFLGSQRRCSHFFDISGDSPPERPSYFVPALNDVAVSSSIFPATHRRCVSQTSSRLSTALQFLLRQFRQKLQQLLRYFRQSQSSLLLYYRRTQPSLLK